MMYLYSRQDLFKEKQHYNYTTFDPYSFLKSWKNDRLKILKSLQITNESPSFLKIPSCYFNTLQWIEHSLNLCHQAILPQPLIGEFLKKFEVRKRLYTFYTNDRFDIHPESCEKDVYVYLKASELFSTYFNTHKKTQFLNTFLKLMDLLCSYHNHQSPIFFPLFQHLLEKEQSIIKGFMENIDL